MSGQLILVATPIGNLSDISERALESFRLADFIAAEDTRVTLKLLNKFNIKKELVSYFEHNKNVKGKIILNRIEQGKTCVLVSDAGMPAISDPGQELVKQCIDKGIDVTVVPGPTALTAALVLSGLNTGRFTFEGFLSVNKKNRAEHLKSLKSERRTMIFYESAHKLKRTLCDMFCVLGNRKIAIVRELTKIYEDVIRTTLKDASERFSKESLKGEIVLVIDGNKTVLNKKDVSIDDAYKIAVNLINDGLTLSESAKVTAKKTGKRRQDIYKMLISYDDVNTDDNFTNTFSCNK